jgi:hypothetical protein
MSCAVSKVKRRRLQGQSKWTFGPPAVFVPRGGINVPPIAERAEVQRAEPVEEAPVLEAAPVRAPALVSRSRPQVTLPTPPIPQDGEVIRVDLPRPSQEVEEPVRAEHSPWIVTQASHKTRPATLPAPMRALGHIDESPPKFENRWPELPDEKSSEALEDWQVAWRAWERLKRLYAEQEGKWSA